MYCSTLKFKNETPGMCCAGGKVKFQELHPTPEPISNLVSGAQANRNIFWQIQLHVNIQNAMANLLSC